MTAPNYTTYNKLPVKATDGKNGVDADWMTRELGKIELAVRAPTALAGTVYNLWDFGADPTGARDSSPAFAKVFRKMGPAGGVILAPTGTYLLSTLVAPTAANVTVLGYGAGTIFTPDFATTTNPVFFANALTGLILKDFAIAGTFAWGVYATGGSGLACENLTVSGGVLRDAGGSKGGGIYVENATKAAIRRCRLSGNGVAGESGWSDIQFNFGTYSVTNSVVADNVCTSTGVSINIVLYDSLRCLVTGNETTGAKTRVSDSLAEGYGIALYKTGPFAAASCGEHIVAANDVHDVEGTGIYVQGNRDTIVADNSITDSCSVQLDTTLNVGGVAFSDSPGSVWDGNRVLRSGKAGCAIAGTSNNISVSGGTIRDVTGLGVAIRGTVTDIAVGGGLVVEDAGSHGIGSWSDVAAERVTVGNVTIRTTGGYGIYAAASTVGWTMGPATISGTSSLPVANFGSTNRVVWPGSIRSISTTTGLDQTYQTILVDASGGAVTVNLPTTSGQTTLRYEVKKIDASANAVTLDGAGAETIDGAATYPLTVQWQSVTVESNGSAWFVL